MSESVLLHNGMIYPMDGQEARAEALAIREGRILRIGTAAEAREALPSPDLEIDLHGRAVLPSFVDNLTILSHEIGAKVFLDLSGLLNVPEIFAMIEQATRRSERGEWIAGYGWNKSHWGWQRFPHRADLDLVSPHHPVFLLSSDGRVAWTNSMALEQIGIRRDTTNPPGGEIERDSTTGAATGILKESAVDLVRPFLPRPETDVLENALRDIVRYYHSVGVTAASTLALQGEIELLTRIDKPLGLDFDLTLHVHNHDRELCAERGWKTGSGVSGFSIGALWAAVDGTLLSRTAWMLEPYVVNWDLHGIQITPGEELEDLARWCLASGWDVLFHASGDAACRTVIETLQKTGFGCGMHTALIAGGDLVSEEDLQGIPKCRLGLCCNPIKKVTESDAGKTYWGNRWNRAHPLNAWKQAGAALRFSSMEPLGGWSPLKALQVATDPAQKGMGLTLVEGLEALCSRFSHTAAEPCKKGLLADGASADLVVLSGDPVRVSSQDISDLRVDMTFYEGRLVFNREGQPS